MNDVQKYSLYQTSRMLNIKYIGRNKIYKILREKGIVDKLNRSYSKYIDEVLLDFAEPPESDSSGIFRPPVTIVVGDKGLEFTRKIIMDYLMNKPTPKIWRRSSIQLNLKRV